MRILGIDPGLNITGYGVVEGDLHALELVEGGVLRGGTSRDLADRLVRLFDGLVDVLTTFRPEALAIEELYSHYERPRTAILMGHARGVLCLAAAQAGVPLHHYSATQVKRVLTGNGRAPKSQVQSAVVRLLNLTDPIDPPDVADALSVAICHNYLAGVAKLK